jgi:hypothetical protein
MMNSTQGCIFKLIHYSQFNLDFESFLNIFFSSNLCFLSEAGFSLNLKFNLMKSRFEFEFFLN